MAMCVRMQREGISRRKVADWCARLRASRVICQQVGDGGELERQERASSHTRWGVVMHAACDETSSVMIKKGGNFKTSIWCFIFMLVP